MSLLADLDTDPARAFADMTVGMSWGVDAMESGADEAPVLTPRAAVAALQAVERKLAQLHALQARLLVAAADEQPHVAEYAVLLPGDDPGREEERIIRIQDAVREEIAAALRWSPVTAQYRIDAARLLAGPLAATATALAQGAITPAHARVVVEHAERLPGRWMRDATERASFSDACAALQQRVLPVASRGTLSRTRTAAVRAVLAIDPHGAGMRRRIAQRTLDVLVADDVDGISSLNARLATEHAHAILRRIARHAEDLGPLGSAADTADGDTGERETIGQRRARALVDLLLGGHVADSSFDGRTQEAGNTAPRLQASLDVLIDLPTLLALRDLVDDSASQDSASQDSASQDSATQEQGSGASSDTLVRAEHAALLAQRVAVPPHVVRDLLADPDVALTLRRLVTDPLTGALLDLGRTTYAIPTRLREFLAARDRTCRFPGCRQPAARCQVDHVIAWDDGGRTEPANLHLLCPRHHQLKTHGGWVPTRQPDGVTVWQSPQGRTFPVPPDG